MVTTSIAQTKIIKKTFNTIAIATLFLLHGNLHTATHPKPLDESTGSWSPSTKLADPYFSLFVDMVTDFNLSVEPPIVHQSFVDLVYLIANRCSPEQKNNLVAILNGKDRAARHSNSPKNSPLLNSKISEALFNALITYLQKSSIQSMQIERKDAMHTINTAITMPKENPMFSIIADFVGVRGNQDQINKFRALFDPERPVTSQSNGISAPKSPETTSDFEDILIMLKNFDSESASGRSVDKFVRLAECIKLTMNLEQKAIIDTIVATKQREAYRSTKQKTNEERNALSEQLFSILMDFFSKKPNLGGALYKEILNFIDENGTEEQATLFKNINTSVKQKNPMPAETQESTKGQESKTVVTQKTIKGKPEIQKEPDVLETQIHELHGRKRDTEYLKTTQRAFTTLVNQSNSFNARVKFPTSSNRIAMIAKNDLVKQAKIVEQAQSTYPIMHKKVAPLIDGFLAYKRKYGSEVEKKLYQTMNRSSFITRLLCKRPIVFYTDSDKCMLRDGRRGSGGFESIGTDQEEAPLLLKDYISYDEMQIAALIGVSVPTHFINDGDRYNGGKEEKAGTYQPEGVYVGLVGARFEKPNLMEWQHMMVTPEQNTVKNGYGIAGAPANHRLSFWQRLYGLTFPTFDEAKADTSGRYFAIRDKQVNGEWLSTKTKYLDTAVYKKRMRSVVEPFLLEAHKRGKEQGKKVYAYMVGLGLGVWQVDPQQIKLFIDVHADVIRDNDLSNISDLTIAHVGGNYPCGGVASGEIFKTAKNSITIHFTQENPAARLSDPNKLTVACYAWDGNSYPGNEYWIGMLAASGDPAAACCSTIPELQNPEINKERISGDCMQIFGK